MRLPGTPEPMVFFEGASGVRIAADYWGDDNGPLVILQHGGGQTRHAWKDAGEALGAAGYYAVAFDARGHGDSDWSPEGEYELDAMVEDLQCVVNALGKGRPALVGASMGGVCSLVAVGEARLDAAALILVDVAPRIEKEGVERIGAFMGQKPEGFDSLEEIADAISNYQPHRKRSKDLSGLAKNVRLAANGKYRWHWDPQIRARRMDIEERRKRLEECARRLTVPTLLVRGGLSDLLTEEGVRDFLRLAPHSEYVNVKDAAHMVAGDRNDVFASAVIAFLTRTVPVHGTKTP
jgi:pimeloyl-ACP methyl ester carboxylesterase